MPVVTRVQWRGPEFDRKVRQVAGQNLYRAGEHLRRSMREEIQKPAPRISRRRKRDTVAGKKGSTYTIRIGSTPPAPPHKRLGFLQTNVVHEHDVEVLESRIGITKAAIYGLYLELGGPKVGPARPWMRLAFLKQLKVIEALIGRFREIR